MRTEVLITNFITVIIPEIILQITFEPDRRDNSPRIRQQQQQRT